MKYSAMMGGAMRAANPLPMPPPPKGRAPSMSTSFRRMLIGAGNFRRDPMMGLRPAGVSSLAPKSFAAPGKSPTIENLAKGQVARGAAFLGFNIMARGFSSVMMPSNPPIPPGAMMSTGKRGIDSNNLNSSGIGLAMYRNRRR